MARCPAMSKIASCSSVEMSDAQIKDSGQCHMSLDEDRVDGESEGEVCILILQGVRTNCAD